jgi:hypothetical protein
VESSRSSHTSEQQTLYASLRSLQDQIIREEDKLLVARQGLDRLLNRRESRGKEGKRMHERRSKLLLEIEEAESSHHEKLLALEEYRRQFSEIQVSPFLLLCALLSLTFPSRHRRQSKPKRKSYQVQSQSIKSATMSSSTSKTSCLLPEVASKLCTASKGEGSNSELSKKEMNFLRNRSLHCVNRYTP